jgi:hypothetical protein
MKLDLPTSATVVYDAIRFVKQQQQKSSTSEEDSVNSNKVEQEVQESKPSYKEKEEKR